MDRDANSNASMQASQLPGDLALTVVFREVREDDETYFVAECVELPGCISQGDSQEEAHRNIQDAIRLCLSVLFEDCMKQIMVARQQPDMQGITTQGRLSVNTTPDVQYEYA